MIINACSESPAAAASNLGFSYLPAHRCEVRKHSIGQISDYINSYSYQSRDNILWTILVLKSKAQLKPKLWQYDLSIRTARLPGLHHPSGWAWSARCISAAALWTAGRTLFFSGCEKGHWSAVCGSCCGLKLRTGWTSFWLHEEKRFERPVTHTYHPHT